MQQMLRSISRVLIVGLVSVSASTVGLGTPIGGALSTPEAAAQSLPCGSSVCSGSDSNTGTNWQGHAPQLYVGEVGIYYFSFPMGNPGGGASAGSGPYNNAFVIGSFSGGASGSGAAGAAGRLGDGGGLGVAFYYFLSGSASSDDNYSDPFCFGWEQGVVAAQHALATYDTYDSDDGGLTYMFVDIEQGTSSGWSPANLSNNRQVFDGFFDYVTGQTNSSTNLKHSGCYGTDNSLVFQPGVYSAGQTSTSNEWLQDMGSSSSGQTGWIPNTPIWPYENKISQTSCPDQPTSWGGAAQFGDSSWLQGWQFCLQNDDDIFTDPMYMPYWGADLY